MKFCYIDESGTGNEPIAVMVGIVVDSQRMHLTKQDWQNLLVILSSQIKRNVSEIHTRDFYSGNSLWREMSGVERSAIITTIFNWFRERKHQIVYASVEKASYNAQLRQGIIPNELNTLWRFLGFHLMLSIQKAHQKHPKNKGNTVVIFDNEAWEQKHFIDLLNNCPSWSDSYYSYSSEKKRLDQIVDAPYFADSKHIGMIQVADFVAYFLRRYAEIKENLIPPKYEDEERVVSNWMEAIKDRTIGKSHIYPQKGRCQCADLFYQIAPKSIRHL